MIIIIILLTLIFLCMFKPMRQLIGALLLVFCLMLWWNWPSDKTVAQQPTAERALVVKPSH